MRSYPDAEELASCIIFRFDAPLIFANARVFRDQIRRLARTDPPPVWIVIAAEPMTDVDTTASDMLEELGFSVAAETCFSGASRFSEKILIASFVRTLCPLWCAFIHFTFKIHHSKFKISTAFHSPSNDLDYWPSSRA